MHRRVRAGALAHAMLLGEHMKPITKAVSMFAVAGAVTAFVPRDGVEPLVAGSLHGDLDLVSFGVATLSAEHGPPAATLHLREAFANRGDRFAWTVDVSAASVWFVGAEQPVHAMLANSDVPTLPVVRVGHGERRLVDLYFPLPPGRSADEDVTPFIVTYRVHTPDHRYETSATLARSTRWPDREERGPEPGWGRAWWADPAYPWTEYRHQPGHAVPRPPARIDIIHAPRGYFEVLPALPADAAEREDWPRTDECNEW